jgi:hypothetical protein
LSKRCTFSFDRCLLVDDDLERRRLLNREIAGSFALQEVDVVDLQRHAIEPATSSNAFTCKGAIGSARDDFAGWPGWGWSALVVFLASIR